MSRSRAILPGWAALRWGLVLALVVAGLWGGSSSRGAEEPGVDEVCACSPPPRWVLRDQDGSRVPARVEPRCGWGNAPVKLENRCLPLEFGSAGSFPCVRIIDHGGRFINLQYDLETGGLERCNRNGPWAEDFTEIAFFIEDSCGGAPYAGFGSSAITNSSHTASRRLDFVDGDIWYVSEDECVEDVSGSYWTIFEPKECLPLSGGAGCPLKPVPEWVRELLPNPPYSMAVEYD